MHDYSPPELYLDHNSTSPITDSVAQAVKPFILSEFGNPSSKNNVFGVRAADALEHARAHVAALIGASTENIVFTSGGTESCFAGIGGVFRASPEKRHLIISAVEHPAVLETAEYLAAVSDIETTIIPVDRNGEIDLEQLSAAIRPDTGLISVMYANNETGIILPLPEVVAIARKRNVPVHTDAVQAVGKLPVRFGELGVDLLSLSAHKFGGLKGAGVLAIREGLRWEAVVKGGGQERGRRGGTEAVPAIVAMGEAARARKHQLDTGAMLALVGLRDFFEDILVERIPDVCITGAKSPRLPNTSSVRIHGTVAQELLQLLAVRGVIVSAGSACHTTNVKPSHVLRAMGISTPDCISTLRFSFGLELSREAVMHLVDILCETVAYFRAETKELLQANLR